MFNQLITLFNATFILGLLWYRMSDHLLPFLTKYLDFAFEAEERYWVVFYNLRRPNCERELDIVDPNDEKIVYCLYFMLTTLSTVGYGDYFPQAVSEKIIGCFVQIIGSSIFSMVMSKFISVVMTDFNN